MMAGMRAQTRASRAAVLALLVLACARGGDEERKAHGAEHDEWHPRRFAQTPAPLSTSHAAAVSSAARLLALGKGDEALQVCRKVLRSDPRHAPCLTMLARVYAARGDAAAARKSAQDAIDADPGWAGAYEALASLYAAQGQRQILLRNNEAAYESYRRILLLDLEGEVLSGTGT